MIPLSLIWRANISSALCLAVNSHLIFSHTRTHTHTSIAVPSFGSINEALEKALLHGIAINSTAILEYDNEMQKMVTVGSKTEGALLQMVATMGKDKGLDPLEFYNIERAKPTTRVFSFSSARKLSSVLVPLDNGSYRLYVKGASEIVLGLCEHYWDANGEPTPGRCWARLSER